MITLLGFDHQHVSEREVAHQGPCGWDDGRWENCLDVAVIEFVRATGHPEIPATHAEAEELRCASGLPATGASNFTAIRAGVKARYGLALPPVVKGATAIWTALAPGTAAVIIGAGSPGGHQAGFTAGHAITAFRLDPVDAVWACDGLAPASYNGERLTKAQLFAYIAGQPTGGAIIGTIVGGSSMIVGFKSATPAIGPGMVRLAAGHSLVNMREAGKKLRTDYPWGIWPPDTEFSVAAGVDLFRWNDAAPVDIEGISPPLDKRNEVYIVHLPQFGGSVYMLRGDAVPDSYRPTSSGYTDAQVTAAVKTATDPLNAALTTERARIAAIKRKVAAGAVDVADD